MRSAAAAPHYYLGNLVLQCRHPDPALGDEKLDAVFIVARYDKEGRVLHPALAMSAMKAGCHVWMEKPPANSVAMFDAAFKYGKYPIG